MSDSLADYAKLLNDVAEICSALIDPAVMPAPGSLADEELRTARSLDTGVGCWGEEPVRASYALAAINYCAALDQAKAMVALMSGECTAVPVMVLGRSLIELSSRAWWLLEPEIGVVARVERYQLTRYASAVEGGRTLLADGIPASEMALHIQTPVMVEDYSRNLGMAVPARQRRGYACGSQHLPPISRRVIDMFREIDVPSVYGHYSAFSHGDARALQQGFQETRTPDGHRFYRPVVDEDTIKGAVAAASWALYPPAYRATTLLGLGQSNLNERAEEQSAVPRLQESRSTCEDSE